MRDDPSVIALVTRVTDGDHDAWDEIIDRYAPLVWSICARFQLSRQDIDDVGQGVWLALVDHIGTLRQPAALAGWLATTARNECLRLLRSAQRYDHAGLPPEEVLPSAHDAAMIEEEIIEAERNAALRAAFAGLGERCHNLLSLLLADPVPAYADISRQLGIPVGSIGPTRARCLDQLRRSPYLADYLSDQSGELGVSEPGR